VPPEVERYVVPGEEVVLIEMPLVRNGVEYRVYYMTTSDYRPEGLLLFRDASAHAFTSTSRTGLVVTADGNVVEDEDTLAEVLSLYRTASFLYETPPSADPIGGIDSDFGTYLLRVTANPLFLEQQLKGLFESPAEQYVEALRGILSVNNVAPNILGEFAQDIRVAAHDGQNALSAIDDTLRLAQYDNSRTIRRTAKSLKETFESWERESANVTIDGTQIELLNALDLLELGVEFLFIADLQQDRSRWLAEFEAGADGPAELDAEQKLAAAIVKKETEAQSIQRADILLKFIKDKGVDLALRQGEDVLARTLAKWAFEDYGTRITGHAVAGAASSVFSGLALANLLYDLDELVDGFKIAERANSLRHRFYNGRLAIQTEVARDRTAHRTTIDGDQIAAYRAAYMLESLAAARVYRAYADAVEATVRKDLRALFNPISLLVGDDWRQGVEDLREAALAVERAAENDIGHPAFLEPAVQVALDRLAGRATLLEAAAKETMPYDIVLPGETAHLTVVMENSGRLAWQPDTVELIGGEDNPDAAPRTLSLVAEVAPGDTVEWDVSFAPTGAPGLRTVTYQLQANDQPFGEVITGFVVLLPKQLKDLEQQIRQKVEDWRQLGEQAAEELMQQIAEELEREMQRLAANLLNRLQTECTSALFAVLGIVFAGWQARRRSQG
jgi:hypothetical protein